MRLLRIEHTTEYQFGGEVRLLPHRLMIRPRESHNIRITSSMLDVSPTPRVRWQRDPWDNSVAVLDFEGSARSLRIASSIDLESYEEAPLDFVVEPHALRYPFTYASSQQDALGPLLRMRWPEERLDVERWLAELGVARAGSETFELLDRMNRAIASGFRYQSRDAEGVQTPAQTLALRSGSCRDFASLFMDTCRCLGLAARFASGYRVMHAPAGPGSTHAWAEVYLPGAGWKGFDSTAGEVTGREHVAVAVTHDPQHVPAVAGSFQAATPMQPVMSVSVRVHERSTGS